VLAREALIGSAPGKAAGKSSTSKQEHLNTEDEMRASGPTFMVQAGKPGPSSGKRCRLEIYGRPTKGGSERA
jgi:hypothetical protein